MSFQFTALPEKPFLLAGPCLAESFDLLQQVCDPLKTMADKLGYEYVFKASFDKANRTSIDSDRGPGLDQALEWFSRLKKEFSVPVLTDIHEVWQVKPVAQVCDVLQIPAFLCRQTDLVVAAVESGRAVNVKKGQFLAPENTHQITTKMNATAKRGNLKPNFALTERGASFGYGNLVVDMRAFPVMAATGSAVIFDITHSLQRPATTATGKTTDGERSMAPVLSRAATATGYLAGFFMEVHTNPDQAKSDAQTQLSLKQAEALLKDLRPLWQEARELRAHDKLFG